MQAVLEEDFKVAVFLVVEFLALCLLLLVLVTVMKYAIIFMTAVLISWKLDVLVNYNWILQPYNSNRMLSQSHAID